MAKFKGMVWNSKSIIRVNVILPTQLGNFDKTFFLSFGKNILMRRIFRYVGPIVIVIGLSSCNFLLSGVITWTGSGTNDHWANPNNWMPVRLPTANDSIYNNYTHVIKITNGVAAEGKYFNHIGELVIEVGGSLTLEELNSKGDLTNKGTITVNNSPKYGIFHSSQTTQSELFINEGEIYIDNAAWAGLFIRFDQTFTNKPGGFIEITNSGQENLLVEGTLQNIGTIRMDGSLTGLGLKVDSENVADPAFLSNDACAKIVVTDQIEIGEGSITNYGFFKQNYDGNNVMGVEQFINYGFLEDIQMSFSIGKINHIGIWLTKLEFVQPKAGDSIKIYDNYFNIPYTSNLSDVYNDRNLTSLAGTLDFATGMWFPNGSAAGDSTFYMEATTVSGSCIDTVRFDTDLKVLDVNYWKGGTGSWQLGINWSKTTVPVATDIVGIFDPDAVVTMPISYTAVGQTLFLEGQLTVTAGSNLNIQGSGSETGIDINYQGKLINNGTVNLTNLFIGAYLNGGQFTNNQNIVCTGNDICFYLLQDQSTSGTLENHGSITSNKGNVVTGFRSRVFNYGDITANIGSANYGINGDTLYNRGNIIIEGIGTATGRGINGVVFNDVDGSITTNQLYVGMDIEGVNGGDLTADNTDSGFINGNDFTNKSGGTITVSNATTGITAYGGILLNESGGTISSTGCETGMYIIRDFENRGEVDILNCSQVGILAVHKIDNLGSGSINISHSGSHGITLLGQFTALVNSDQAMITISQAAGYGILVEGADLFNTGSAKIFIDPSGLDQLHLKPYTYFTTTYNAALTNEGYIWLRQ